MRTREFDFIGSEVICEGCRKPFELYDNAIWLCENCHENCVECKDKSDV